MTEISKLEKCVLALKDIGVVKFGDYLLKSGMRSPVYFDLRIIISYPELQKTVSELLWSAVPKEKQNSYNHVCGVAYTGIPLATVISVDTKIPMLLKRKEAKAHGTKKLVEGVYKARDTCLIIEDVLVTGGSVFETVETLRELGLTATDAVVFLDREQGGVKSLAEKGVNMVSVVTLSQMMNILLKHNKIEEATVKEVDAFISTHNKTSIPLKKSVQVKPFMSPPNPRITASYVSRADAATHPLSKKLFHLMAEKSSNLCVAADVSTAVDLLELCNSVGPHVCMIKTHIDILDSFTADDAKELCQLANKHNFLILEDKKFVDIGATVCKQFKRLVDWTDAVTIAPVLGGDGVLQGLEDALTEVSERDLKGAIIVAEMSCKGALKSSDYINCCLNMTKSFPNLVMGFVCQSSITSDPGLIQFTPGVSMSASSDALGQQYVKPEIAVKERSADVIIVGRAITKADDPAAEALRHKQEGFNAYLARIKSE